MATIIIPFPFRKHTENKREVILGGENLGLIMDELIKQYPGLQIINEQPGLLSIFVNGKSIQGGTEEWAAVPVADSDEISLIIPIAGG